MASASPPRDPAARPTPGRTYAVGDVHGRFDLLAAAIDLIDAHVGSAPFRVVMLGDYVDRGPQSREVIDLLMELQQRWRVTCLKGNHEDLMVQAVANPDGGRLSLWLANGGRETLQSYGLTEESDLAAGIPREHLRWLNNLPRTTGDGHRIYVHAGLKPKTPLEKQNDETFLWIRERFLTAKASDFESHVVHGHTPIWDGKPEPGEPELLGHRTNLDTGAFATGILTIGVFDAATPGGPTEVLKVRGAPMGEFIADPPDAKAPARERRRGLGGWFGSRSGTDASR